MRVDDVREQDDVPVALIRRFQDPLFHGAPRLRFLSGSGCAPLAPDGHQQLDLIQMRRRNTRDIGQTVNRGKRSV